MAREFQRFLFATFIVIFGFLIAIPAFGIISFILDVIIDFFGKLQSLVIILCILVYAVYTYIRKQD